MSFESTEHFASSQAALLKAYSGSYIFQKQNVDDFHYDADAGVMKVTPGFTDETLPGIGTAYLSIATDVVSLGRRTYVGENGFGVKKLITEMSYETYGLSFTADSVPSISDSYEFAIPAGEARLLKPFLRLEICATLAEAHIYQKDTHDTPTISSPLDVRARKNYLLARLLQIRIIDVRNGKTIRALGDD